MLAKHLCIPDWDIRGTWTINKHTSSTLYMLKIKYRHYNRREQKREGSCVRVCMCEEREEKRLSVMSTVNGREKEVRREGKNERLKIQ